MTQHKKPDETTDENQLQEKQHHPLSHRDATAASPDDESVCGEEDPGAALESMVNYDK